MKHAFELLNINIADRKKELEIASARLARVDQIEPPEVYGDR